MYILGISAYYHDSSAVLLKDGKIVAAAEEERFTRIKHDNAFPFRAIQFCLDFGGISISDIDAVSYYEKPLLKFERILENFVDTYPYSLKPFLKGMPEWLDYKIKIELTIRKKLEYGGKVYFVPHHHSHAACTFLTSPYSEAAVLTIDGVGEYQTTGLWHGKNRIIKQLKSIHFPHSLGLLYSTFTSFLGFKVNEDEYKLMGLAAYGKPTFITSINQLIKVKEDGSFIMDMKYFAFRESFQMWSKKFEELFGKPRKPKDPITKRDKDLAASIQKVTEETYFKIANHLYILTKSRNLCISGGVGLNALANGKLYKETPFKKIFVFGAAGDNGAALGSALYSYHQMSLRKAIATKQSQIANLYLGSEYNGYEIEKELKRRDLKYKKFRNTSELVKKTAELLVQNKVIGWFQGRMEFGPRALGNRSILANPKEKWMKERVNVIKRREQFRPFAGSVLQERTHEYFEVPEKNHWSPFMTFCFRVKKEKQNHLSAIVHPDGTCRIQTVSKDNGIYFELIKEFDAQTGIPCILNTSFNLKGEPIVETPKQAIEDFLKTKMDYLVIGDYFLEK